MKSHASGFWTQPGDRRPSSLHCSISVSDQGPNVSQSHCQWERPVQFSVAAIQSEAAKVGHPLFGGK